MSRSRHRTSRVLLVMLAGSVAVFAVIFVRNQRLNRAEAAATAQPAIGVSPNGAQAAPTVPVTPSDEADALITQAPTGNAAPLAKPSAATGSATPVATPGGPTGTSTSGQKPAINDTLVFSPSKVEGDAWAMKFTVPSGGVLAKIAKRFHMTPELLARINDISDPRRLRAGQTIKVLQGPLHAVVDKSDFTLDLYFGAPGGPGSSYVTTYRVGLGKDDSTPTGKWLCEANKKLANPTYYSSRGEGVIAADDPKNPLGEFWIGLTGVEGQAVGKASYGIHGTIEPESIGTMASMGCIRLKNEDITHVYEALVDGQSTVVIQE